MARRTPQPSAKDRPGLLGALGDALGWMERVGAQWDDRLGRLRRHLGG